MSVKAWSVHWPAVGWKAIWCCEVHSFYSTISFYGPWWRFMLSESLPLPCLYSTCFQKHLSTEAHVRLSKTRGKMRTFHQSPSMYGKKSAYIAQKDNVLYIAKIRYIEWAPSIWDPNFLISKNDVAGAPRAGEESKFIEYRNGATQKSMPTTHHSIEYGYGSKYSRCRPQYVHLCALILHCVSILLFRFRNL